MRHDGNDSSHDSNGGDDRDHSSETPKISNLIFFGDSLTDNGNLFKLIGFPPAPWWQGRFSNGPTYAEQLPALLGVSATHVQNYAFGGARAQTGNSIPIDLDIQVQSFIASLHGHQAAKGTEAALYIGNNDYLNYNPAVDGPPATFIAGVMAHIQGAITTLKAHGVDKIVLFTLPHFSVTPAGQFLAAHGGGATVAGADAIIDANNAALKQLAAADIAAGIDVKIVDANVFADAIGADPHAFGFKNISIPVITGNTDTPTGIDQIYAPNEIAFFNDIHPTYAAHGVQAAFAGATLTADHVQLFTTGGNTYTGTSGTDFIFAIQGGNTFFGGAGDDIVYAGNGHNLVNGGAGNDLIFAGGGFNTLIGGQGTDLLAVNSGSAGNAGSNILDSGQGNDILVANRGVSNVLHGGSGDNLIIFKEDAGAAFAAQTIDNVGGEGVLRFIINDQNSASAQALEAEFTKVASAFEASLKTNHHGTFSIDNLDVHGISGVQLQVDSVDPTLPYKITHTITHTVGDAPEIGSAGAQLLAQASLWGLLTA